MCHSRGDIYAFADPQSPALGELLKADTAEAQPEPGLDGSAR